MSTDPTPGRVPQRPASNPVHAPFPPELPPNDLPAGAAPAPGPDIVSGPGDGVGVPPPKTADEPDAPLPMPSKESP